MIFPKTKHPNPLVILPEKKKKIEYFPEKLQNPEKRLNKQNEKNKRELDFEP